MAASSDTINQNPRTRTRQVSAGEAALPLLFAAIETCWLYAAFTGLASLPFWHSGALLPLWIPFVIIIGTQYVASLFERWRSQRLLKGKHLPGKGLMLILIALGTLLLIWWRIYASTTFFFNPIWLLALLKDVLALDMRAWTAFLLCVSVSLMCWRATQFMHHEDKAQFLTQTLLLGAGIIIAVIVVEAGQGTSATSNAVFLFLLIPVFLFLGLLGQALAQVIYIRRYHLSAMHGSVGDQERSIFLWTGMSGLFLVIMTMLVAFIANGSLLTSTQRFLAAAYDWLVNICAVILGFLLTPFTWLAWLLAHLLGKRQSTPSILTVTHCEDIHHIVDLHIRHVVCPPAQGHVATGNNPLLLLIIKLMLPVLVLLITLTLIRRAAHQRRLRGVVVQESSEIHENIWSWALFWQQLKAFWLALWLRFIPAKQREKEQTGLDLYMESVPAARSIREIYRLLLKRGARYGYARKKNETPYEYLLRLRAGIPLLEAQLTIITEAYTAVRYGGVVPGEAEISQLRMLWKRVEEQWK